MEIHSLLSMGVGAGISLVAADLVRRSRTDPRRGGKLDRQDEILQAVGFAAERLLRAGSWEDSIDEVLARLGEASGVSRVYVFRNRRDDNGTLRMTQVFEWVRPGISTTLDDPLNTDYPYSDGFDRWERDLGAGRTVQALRSDAPEAERLDMESEGILSIVVVPVFADADWWGFVGFDDCVAERTWTRAEIDALRTAAETLGAAIERQEVQARLADAEAMYRTMVERLPAIVYLAAPGERGPWRYVSPRIGSILGYAAEEWVADHGLWVARIHPNDRDRVLAEEAKCRATGQPLVSEYRMIARDGRVVWLRDEAELVTPSETEPGLLRGVLLDVTARKEAELRLEETTARYQALVEHIPAVLYVDPPDESQPTVYVSPQIEGVLGVTAEAYIGDPNLWLELVHPDDREALLSQYRTELAARESWAAEYRVVHPDGRIVWFRDVATFLSDEDGRPHLIQGVMTDITEHKLAEEALRQSERLEREAAARLRHLHEMKDIFLAAVSHELRTPLSAILGLSLTLERQRLPWDEQVELLGRLAANARKLDDLLRNLLDVDRLSRGLVTAQRRPTDVGKLIGSVVEGLGPDIGRSIVVEVDHVEASVDPSQVERIVENLIANAIRHTPPGSTVWVRARWDGDGVLILVEDDGPGVPEELRPNIFEPFQRGTNVPTHAPGTGIGLSIVAMMADLHGGSVVVEDREGGGASFRVLLPVAARPTETHRGDDGDPAPPDGAAPGAGVPRSRATPTPARTGVQPA